MKSLKIISIFILSLFVFTIASCDDEPLEGDFSINNDGSDVTCAQATQTLSTASANYGTTSIDDVSYPVVCNAYAVALQNVINTCGDDTGAIQTLLDGLDCTSISQNCTDAQIITTSAETAYNADTTNQNLCLAYKTALENEITECGDIDGGLQSILDGLDCTSSNDLPCNLVLATGGSPDYSDYEGITFNYGIYKDYGLVDSDENGISNHFKRVVLLSNNPIVLNPDGTFNSIEGPNPAAISFNLYLYNQTEFVSDTFEPFYTPNESTTSYINFGSVAYVICTYLNDGDDDCDGSALTFADSVVNVEVTGSTVEICFDVLFLFGIDEGIEGLFTGELIETTGGFIFD